MPEPLHPLVVHFPIALCVLTPLVAVCALLAIRNGTKPRCAYGAVLAAQVLLTASAYVAKRTGGGDEKHVAEIVAHEIIEHHEESADRFVLVCFVLVALAALGMLANSIGRFGRVAHLLGCVVLCWFGFQAGSSGGELVYEHGAAEAFR